MFRNPIATGLDASRQLHANLARKIQDRKSGEAPDLQWLRCLYYTQRPGWNAVAKQEGDFRTVVLARNPAKALTIWKLQVKCFGPFPSLRAFPLALGLYSVWGYKPKPQKKFRHRSGAFSNSLTEVAPSRERI